MALTFTLGPHQPFCHQQYLVLEAFLFGASGGEVRVFSPPCRGPCWLWGCTCSRRVSVPPTVAGSLNLMFLFNFQCWALRALLKIPEPLPWGGVRISTPMHACMRVHTRTRTCTHPTFGLGGSAWPSLIAKIRRQRTGGQRDPW